MDLILCSGRDVTQGEAATAALVTALTNGQLAAGSFQTTVDRITALRASLS
jgi:beta-N-acetylhexosaminidase